MRLPTSPFVGGGTKTSHLHLGFGICIQIPVLKRTNSPDSAGAAERVQFDGIGESSPGTFVRNLVSPTGEGGGVGCFFLHWLLTRSVDVDCWFFCQTR